jgi:hypothetical protein
MNVSRICGICGIDAKCVRVRDRCEAADRSKDRRHVIGSMGVRDTSSVKSSVAAGTAAGATTSSPISCSIKFLLVRRFGAISVCRVNVIEQEYNAK